VPLISLTQELNVQAAPKPLRALVKADRADPPAVINAGQAMKKLLDRPGMKYCKMLHVRVVKAFLEQRVRKVEEKTRARHKKRKVVPIQLTSTASVGADAEADAVYDAQFRDLDELLPWSQRCDLMIFERSVYALLCSLSHLPSAAAEAQPLRLLAKQALTGLKAPVPAYTPAPWIDADTLVYYLLHYLPEKTLLQLPSYVLEAYIQPETATEEEQEEEEEVQYIEVEEEVEEEYKPPEPRIDEEKPSGLTVVGAYTGPFAEALPLVARWPAAITQYYHANHHYPVKPATAHGPTLLVPSTIPSSSSSSAFQLKLVSSPENVQFH